MGRLVQGKNQTAKVIGSKGEREKDRYKNAKQCIKCESNKEGYCKEFSRWCSRARIECPKCTEKPSDYYSNGLLIIKTKKAKNKKKSTQKRRK